MKKKKDIARVGPELPVDLLFELFARLPAKKLLQLTCVSKLWCSIIRDDQFVQAYKNRSPLCLVVSIPQNHSQRYGVRIGLHK